MDNKLLLLTMCFTITIITAIHTGLTYADETIELISYYPSPIGNYESLRTKQMSVGQDNTGNLWDLGNATFQIGGTSSNPDILYVAWNRNYPALVVDINGNLGIKTATPSEIFEIVDMDINLAPYIATTPVILVSDYGISADPPTLKLRKAQAGVNNPPYGLYSGMPMGQITFGGYADIPSPSHWLDAVKIKAVAASDFNSQTPEAELQFFTTNAANGLTQKMVINEDGKIGLGITTPTKMLHIVNDVNSIDGMHLENTSLSSETGDTSAAVGINLVTDPAYTLTFFRLFGPNHANADYQNRLTIANNLAGGSIDFQAGATGTGIFLSSSGDVGLGTTNPAAKLDVQGGINALGNISALGTGNISSFAGDITTLGGKIGVGTTNPASEVDVNGDISASGNITTTGNFVTTGAGKIGVGTNTPVYEVDIDGSIRATKYILFGGTAGSTSPSPTIAHPYYVFEDDYNVLSIEEVENHLKKEKYLPWMTSEKEEREENGTGIDMTRLAFETVETVENLQLQIITLNNLVKKQTQLAAEQQQTISTLKQKIAAIENKL